MERLRQRTSTMSLNLRDYQQQGISEVHEKFQQGLRKVLFALATGGGKTLTFVQLIKNHFDFGLPVVVVVKRRNLVNQTSKVLDNYGIPHGIHMGGHWRKDGSKLVQVCSVDTLSARDIYPHIGNSNTLVIVDESHDARKTGKKYNSLFSAYGSCFILGFTATPFGDNSWFESVVNPIQAYELRDQGYLVPERTFAPATIDASKVQLSGGDYNKRQLFEVSSGSRIIGDIVKSWKRLGEGRPTLLFAVNIKHSKMIRDKFLDEGIPAIHLDANSTDTQRISAISELTLGKIKVVCNVDIFSVGFDAPQISCIQVCRPTRSLIWHIQALGRGLRPHPGKENCIVIDNAGNTLEHGSIYMPREISLEPPPKRSKKSDIEMKTCIECFFVYPRGPCPNCGFAEKRERNIDYVDGELTILETDQKAIEKAHILSRYNSLKRNKKARYIPSFAKQRLQKEFGDKWKEYVD